MIKRRKTKTVKIGSAKIGAGYPVSIQSMTKTDTACVAVTVRQIKALERAGCEMVRVALKDRNALSALEKIKAKINIPLVADIHFNYRLALEAVARGVDCLRLNPGNIYRREEVGQIAQAAGKRKIPIRIGVNAGSLIRNTQYACLPARLTAKLWARQAIRNRQLADLMVKSALDYIKMLESFNFYDIIISMKASSVAQTVKAYRKMACLCRYPFHLGITAAGLPPQGTIKSAIGIGSLLLEGIGDTIRVSLTGSPQEEVRAAKEILQSLGLRNFSPEIIACPTCGRCQIDVVKITQKVKRKLYAVRNTPACRLASRRSCGQGRQYAIRPPKVAIMGCEVNGPQEAQDADVGIAGGKHCAVLFKKGRIVRRIKESQIVDTLIKELASEA